MRYPTMVLEEQKSIVRKALIHEVANSNERWPAHKCPTCDAITILARKWGLDISKIWEWGLAIREGGTE